MEKIKEKKNNVLRIIVFCLFVACTAASYVFYGYLFGENSIFHKAVAENHVVQTLYGKIPAVIRSVQIITIAILLHLLLSFLITKSMSRSKRRLTIAKLLNSFLKWIVIIVSVLFILDAWGVDTTAIIASAGILSLVVGLGAQSLVADIIAGLFIVIEGEYQVGDIVVIDDWRGTVTEIGIRTTKIEDAGGNIKIVNNSEIKTLINQTQALSVAKVVMPIEYSESLERVELILRDNLEKIKERIPDIVDGPFYKGVTMLNTSSVDLLILANCQEENIYQVQRDLNRELKLLFDKNDVTIPFPQVVVNPPGEGQTKATKRTQTHARAFLEEQKVASKDVEEEAE